MTKQQLALAIKKLAVSKGWLTLPDSGEILEFFPMEYQEDVEAAMQLVDPAPKPQEPEPVKTIDRKNKGRPASELVAKVAQVVIDHQYKDITILYIVKKIYGEEYHEGHERAVKAALRKANHASGVLRRRGVKVVMHSPLPSDIVRGDFTHQIPRPRPSRPERTH